MAEISISKPEDVQKLAGWTIETVEIINGATPRLTFGIRHIAAAHKVKFTVTADISFGRSGNIVVANPSLVFKAEDMPDES